MAAGTHLLIEAALKTKHILQEPAPFVLQNALQDSYVQYEINAYTNEPKLMVFTYSDLHGNIQDCFFAAGVEIMSPIYSALRDGNQTQMPGQFLQPTTGRRVSESKKTMRLPPHPAENLKATGRNRTSLWAGVREHVIG